MRVLFVTVLFVAALVHVALSQDRVPATNYGFAYKSRLNGEDSPKSMAMDQSFIDKHFPAPIWDERTYNRKNSTLKDEATVLHNRFRDRLEKLRNLRAYGIHADLTWDLDSNSWDFLTSRSVPESSTQVLNEQTYQNIELNTLIDPSSYPTTQPTEQPTEQPSSLPSSQPTGQPSDHPSAQPSAMPSTHPSNQPTAQPTGEPIGVPTSMPSAQPILAPTSLPTYQPLSYPTSVPTQEPTLSLSGVYTQYPWEVLIDAAYDSVVDSSQLSFKTCTYTVNNVQTRSTTGNICNFRTAISYCLKVVPWSSGRVLSCRIKFPARWKTTVTLGDIVLQSPPNSGRYPMRIVIDGQDATVTGNFQQQFLTTNPGNDSNVNITLSRPRRLFEEEENSFHFDRFSVNDRSFDLENDEHSDLYRRMREYGMSEEEKELELVKLHPLSMPIHHHLQSKKMYTIPMDQSTLLIQNLNVKNFGHKLSNGGCIKVDGMKSVTIIGGSFTNCQGLFGGAIFVYNTTVVTVTNSKFTANSAETGGALGLFDIQNVSISGNKFQQNSASNIGGGIALDLINFAFLKDNNCSYNRATTAFGGGLSAVRIFHLLSLTTNTFYGNAAKYGSAISLTGNYDVLMSGNSFMYNKASFAGGVYWIYESGMNEPQGLRNSSTFFMNQATNYGPNYATEPLRMTSDPTYLTVNNYSSYAYPVRAVVTMFDYYNSVTPQDRGTQAKIYIRSRDVVFCLFNSDNSVIVGNSSEPIHTGVAVFDRFKISCIPGGYLYATVTAYLSRNAYDYPVYTYNNTLSTLPSKEVSMDIRVNFRGCLAGEKYDYFTATRSTCSVCKKSYSFKDNQDRNITTCMTCPTAAKYCIGNQILLFEGTFRWTHYSTRIFQCPLIGGCKGGNETGAMSCNAGFYGPWCGYCSEGFYLAASSQTCKPCAGSRAKKLSLTDILFVVLSVLAVSIPLSIYIVKKYFKSTDDEDRELGDIMKNVDRDSQDPEHVKMLLIQARAIKKARQASWISRAKITLVTYQIVIQSPLTLQMDFPDYFTSFVQSISVINLNFVQVMPFGCYYNFHFIENMAVTTLIPFVILAAFLVFYILQALFILCTVKDLVERRTQETKARMRYITIFVMFIYFVLPSFSNLIFQTFDCVNVDPLNEVTLLHKYLLRVDFAVDCKTDRYQMGKLWALVMVGIYPIGLPLLFLWLLYLCKDEIVNRDHLEKAKHSNMVKYRRNFVPRTFQRLAQSISFMYLAYEPAFWFWEFVEITRRLLLTAVLSLIFGGSIAQVTISIALSLIYIKLYNQYKPYVLPSEDALAEMGQYQIFFTFFAASIIRQRSLGEYESLYTMMDFLLVFINLFAVFLNVYYFVNDIRDGINVNRQIETILSESKHMSFEEIKKSANLLQLSSYYTDKRGEDDEADKERKEIEEKEKEEKEKKEPIKLVQEKWKTTFDVSNKEDLKLFIEIVNNMSDDDVFRMQAMIYENIIRYDRKFDEKIWIYCHDPILLGTLEEIKAGKPRDNALLHAVPLRIDYEDGEEMPEYEPNDILRRNPKIPIPKYVKELLAMEDIGFEGALFRRRPRRHNEESKENARGRFYNSDDDTESNGNRSEMDDEAPNTYYAANRHLKNPRDGSEDESEEDRSEYEADVERSATKNQQNNRHNNNHHHESSESDDRRDNRGYRNARDNDDFETTSKVRKTHNSRYRDEEEEEEEDYQEEHKVQHKSTKNIYDVSDDEESVDHRRHHRRHRDEDEDEDEDNEQEEEEEEEDVASREIEVTNEEVEARNIYDIHSSEKSSETEESGSVHVRLPGQKTPGKKVVEHDSDEDEPRSHRKNPKYDSSNGDLESEMLEESKTHRHHGHRHRRHDDDDDDEVEEEEVVHRTPARGKPRSRRDESDLDESLDRHSEVSDIESINSEQEHRHRLKNLHKEKHRTPAQTIYEDDDNNSQVSKNQRDRYSESEDEDDYGDRMRKQIKSTSKSHQTPKHSRHHDEEEEELVIEHDSNENSENSSEHREVEVRRPDKTPAKTPAKTPGKTPQPKFNSWNNENNNAASDEDDDNGDEIRPAANTRNKHQQQSKRPAQKRYSRQTESSVDLDVEEIDM